MNNKGAEMYSLICTFVVCMQENQVFSQQGPYNFELLRLLAPIGPFNLITGGFFIDFYVHIIYQSAGFLG